MAVIDDFKARFTEFDTSDVDTYLPALIEEYPYFYGGDYDESDNEKFIILYLLAHLLVGELALQSGSGSDKIEASKSVGSVSVSFFNGQYDKQDEFFMTTRYGMRYLRLIAKNLGARWVG